MRLAGLLLGALATTMACSAGPTDRDPPAPPAEPLVEVALTLTPTVRGSRLTLAGTTDLPDGAILIYEVRHERWSAAGERQWLRDGRMVVEDGAFSARVRLGSWPAGTLDAWIAFQTVLPEGQQPEAMIALFGDLGQRIGGAHASQLGDIKRAELTVRLDR